MAKTFRTNQNLINDGFRQSTGYTLSLSGNTLIGNCATFKYATNQHTKYTARSITDADYVTGLTSGIRLIGSNQQLIYRDISGITGATGFIYDNATSGVTVPNLYISQAPVNEVGDYFLLTWDSGTTKVGKINAVSVTGLQCATNGLGIVGDCACLGGLLINDTTICGSDIYSLRLQGLCGMCIITTANNIVLDSRCNSGGIYLKSQCGTISSPISNFSSAIGIAIDYPSDIFKIYDNRSGVSQRGIEYAGDYSAFYSQRSIVDKSYVDAIAAGLQPHPAVDVATTGNTVLTGLTGTTIIDSIVLSQGNRILIKNQIDAKKNGIYILTGTTFVRAGDFNESSESIHGAYTFVISGATNANTSWVLSTPNPITIDVTLLTFTLFAQVTDIIAGTGITISKFYGQNTISVNGPSIAGNSLLWNNLTCKFDVDISGGTLATALSQTITGATNGLTKSGQELKLGGTLTGSTVITDSRAIKVGIQYAGSYSSGFTLHSLIDKEYVDTQMSSGGTYNLQSPAAICVGGICVGTVLTGKTAFELFEELLVPELFGIITAPSTSISLSSGGTFEVGCVISQLIIGTFNRGCINPQYCSLSDKRSGCANAYCFTGCGMPIGLQTCVLTPATQTNATYTLSAGTQTWGVCTRYDAGCPALGSKGTQYCAALVSGCTAAANSSITGLYPYYYGKLTSGSRPAVTNVLVTGGTKVVASSTGTVTVTFSSVGQWTWLAIPSSSTSKTCWFVTALDNGRINNAPTDKYPDECVFSICSGQGCWTSQNYKVYVSGFAATDASAIQFRNS